MAPKDRGKSIDRSTAWSDFVWDADGQYWWTSRTGPSGKTEYDYRYPETEQTPQQKQEIPRSPGPNIITSHEPQDNTASETAEETNYDASEHSDYGMAASAGTSLYQSTQNYQVTTAKYYIPSTTGEFRDSATGSSFENSFLSKTISSTGSFNSYGSSPTSGVPDQEYDESGEITRSMRGLKFSPQPTIREQEQGFEQPADAGTYPQTSKLIKSPANSGTYETLDPRYRVVPDKEQKKFWKVGRVFMMLWTEPAAKVPVGGGTRDGSHFSTVWLSEKVYSEIRRFVVIREGYGNSICCPIHTYSGQATLKPNLPEQQQHAIIYTSNYPPEEYSYEAVDGTLVRESLIRDPIKVKREQKGKEGDLGATSRLNYSKLYTVENYVRVLNIGMVENKSLPALTYNSYIDNNLKPPEPPTNYPPSKDVESKNKPKERGKEKHRRHR